MNIKNVLVITAIAAAPFIGVSSAFAAGTTTTPCEPIYGGGQTCATPGAISINKTVQNPATNQFVDNLGVNDQTFKSGQNVTFHLDVKNTGNSDLTNVSVSDTLPQFVTFTSGTGNFDANTKTLTFTIDKLSAGQDKTYTVVATVVSQDKLPGDQSTVCVVNQSQAVTTDGQTAGDNAQFCISNQVTTKGGLPVMPPTQVKSTPPTGPEDLALLGLIPTGVVGMLLRKKS